MGSSEYCGARIHEIRLSRRISSSSVCQAIGKNRWWLSRIEKGTLKLTDKEASKLAQLLLCLKDDFYI